MTGAIQEYIHQDKENATPFIWTASVKDILAKVKRVKVALNKL